MAGPPPDFWDARFAEPILAYGSAPNDFLADHADRLPVGRTLCLAEGQGRNAVYLAQHGHDVLAVDLSAVGLERAHQLAAERGVEIETRVVDLAHFDIEPGGWDCIVSVFAHTPADVRRRLHAQVAKGLRPGGAFLLEAYTPEQTRRDTGGPSGDAAIDITMTVEGLRRELAGLRLEIAHEIEREVHEGPYHRGLAAVVQVFGWKA